MSAAVITVRLSTLALGVANLDSIASAIGVTLDSRGVSGTVESLDRLIGQYEDRIRFPGDYGIGSTEKRSCGRAIARIRAAISKAEGK